jgi:hypothetical protein
MAKTKTTRKYINSTYDNVICVGYCNIQYLLNYEREAYYCTRTEGWACDIYIFDNINVAISTGYAPFGNVRPPYELMEKYNTKAEKIVYDYSIEYEKREELVRKLLIDFITECLKKKAK